MSEITINRKEYGSLKDGRTAYLYTLKNENGMKVEITNYGAIIVRLFVADKNDNFDDIVLGYDKLEDYLSDSNYFGAVIGRYSNRIAGAKLELNGDIYQLEINETLGGKPCCLHGGKNGFNKQLWTVKEVELDGKKGIKLTHLSEDGEGGFPGNLKAVVYYTLSNDNKLRVEYRAEADQETVINLTQHSYFNLKGHDSGKIEDHLLYLNANNFTPITKAMIPTGEIRSVENSPFDFREMKEIGKNINKENKQLAIAGGFDHNFVLNNHKKDLNLAAEVVEAESGRKLEVWTTEPGIQFYSGNGISTEISGKNNSNYKKRSGLCLETQHYPDSPNQEEFPSTILMPGEKYRSVTEFRFDLI